MRKRTLSEGHSMRKNRKGGFTLVELLIVVAIIGVLVAISVPIFSAQLHKARVATDWANLRAYYSEIQADFIATGKYNDKVPTDYNDLNLYDRKEITFLDGHKVKMKDGYYSVLRNATTGNGYQIYYFCNRYRNGSLADEKTCALALGVNGS